jgi:hypothetical protein
MLGRVVSRWFEGAPLQGRNLPESSCRTTSELISGSHLGHDHAEARGDRQSARVASWPAERVVFIVGMFLLEATISKVKGGERTE